MKPHGIILLVAVILMTLLLGGCAGDPRRDHTKWTLPKKENAASAMIIGRMDYPDNKKENPEGYHLLLDSVVFKNAERSVYFCQGNLPCGERAYTLDNYYFVVPNLKPGRYYFSAFVAGWKGAVINNMPHKKDEYIELRPGEIRYIGSIDYIEKKQSAVRNFFNMTGSFGLRLNKHPSEYEMLEWLYSTSKGSGWEPTIMARMKKLKH